MCGIVGCIGQNHIQTVILNGLEKLEYRGYDSAGVFTQSLQNANHLTKKVGRIATLRAAVDEKQDAFSGIGHTRWATHGPATQENAHPHQSQSGRFTLVHNGVIENYAELKETFLSHVTFYSQTDTEVAVNLIAYFAEEKGLSTQDALLEALKHIQGSYAFGLLDVNDPEVLYAAKNKSPLLIGLGKQFNVICSDAMATIQETDTYIAIQDKEIVVLRENTVDIFNFNGERIEREAFKAEIDSSDIEKGTYPHYMLKEMDEQPAVLRRLLQEYTAENGKLHVDDALLNHLKDSDRIYIIACGTSYHAGWIGKSLIESMANIPVEVLIASEFAYNQPLLSKKPFFIFITQSGETADSRQALVRVNALNHPSLTITNVKGSTLSREANYTLLLHAGPEIAVASTKAYTAQIAVLAILAETLRESLGLNETMNMSFELSRVASVIEGILADKATIQNLVHDHLLSTRNAFYIGRHLDYYVAMEAALKLKEISYVQTESFAAGELKHGTIALIEEDTPVIALLSDSHLASHTRGNIEEVKARGARVMRLAMEGCHRENDDYIIPAVHASLTPLAMVVVTQLIAYYTALGKDLDVDKPRNLAKSVTVE
ncbi:glutamine--fructose-6-phosphate transaminase (isomerizing) [Carnobacteriaceae bacterium zg-C25]|nr:glutamine--fructose-6-phosphate transaminase (isomerizing) [Carnobacteriaceae bacterium zg-C25]